MQAWSWFSFCVGALAVALIPIFIRASMTSWNAWLEIQFEKKLRAYAVYHGEGAPSVEALITLLQVRASPQCIVEVDSGALFDLSHRLGSMGFGYSYKFIPKLDSEDAFFPKDQVYFLVFAFKEEKEKFCVQFPDHVLVKDPFEFCGESPLTPRILKYHFSA